MSALRRAEQDEQTGDLGSARMRLVSYVVTTKYDGAVCERIARLCCRMGDPVEAGKWYFLCDSKDESAERCIQHFQQRHGNSPKSVLANLPASIVSDVKRGLAPAIIVSRLAACDPEASTSASRSHHHRNVFSLRNRVGYVGCISLLALVTILTMIGLATLIRWVLA